MKQIKTISYIDKKGNVQTLPDKEKRKREDTKDYSRYLNIGFYLAAPLLIGVFLGIRLDVWFNLKPVFTVTLIVFGAVASLYNLYKLTKDA